PARSTRVTSGAPAIAGSPGSGKCSVRPDVLCPALNGDACATDVTELGAGSPVGTGETGTWASAMALPRTATIAPAATIAARRLPRLKPSGASQASWRAIA